MREINFVEEDEEIIDVDDIMDWIIKLQQKLTKFKLE
jgi:hypothetical protein